MKVNKKGVEGISWTVIVLVLGVIVLFWAVGNKGLLGMTRDTTKGLNEQVSKPLLAQLKGFDFSRLSAEQIAQMNDATKEQKNIDDARAHFLKAQAARTDEEKKDELQKAMKSLEQASKYRSGENPNLEVAKLISEIDAYAKSLQAAQKLNEIVDSKDVGALEAFVNDPKNPPIARAVAAKYLFILQNKDKSKSDQRSIIDSKRMEIEEGKDNNGYGWLTLGLIYMEMEMPWDQNKDANAVLAFSKIIDDDKYENDRLLVSHAYMLRGNAEFSSDSADETTRTQQLKQSLEDYYVLHEDYDDQLATLYPEYKNVMLANLRMDKADMYLRALDVEIYLTGELEDEDNENKPVPFENIPAYGQGPSILHTLDYQSYYKSPNVLKFIVDNKDYVKLAGDIDGFADELPLYFTITVTNPYTQEVLCAVKKADSPLKAKEYDRLLPIKYEEFTEEDNLVGKCGRYISIWSKEADRTGYDDKSNSVTVTFASQHFNEIKNK